jgi:hypothetical protein
MIVLLSGSTRTYFSGGPDSVTDDFEDRERDELDDRFRPHSDYDDR